MAAMNAIPCQYDPAACIEEEVELGVVYKFLISKEFKFIEFVLIFMGGIAGIFLLWLILFIFEVISGPNVLDF